jgi:hypothetical protein
MNRFDEINALIKSLNEPNVQIKEMDEDFGYLIIGAPTITDNEVAKGAFTLNHPARLVELPKINTYVDRVQIPLSSTDKEIERVVRLMKQRAATFKSKNGTHHNEYGFEMPGYEGKFCRQMNEDGTQLELRYYVQSFARID